MEIYCSFLQEENDKLNKIIENQQQDLDKSVTKNTDLENQIEKEKKKTKYQGRRKGVESNQKASRRSFLETRWSRVDKGNGCLREIFHHFFLIFKNY